MVNPRTFTGTEARQLLRRARTGTLATLNREGGIPYASLANVATDLAGWPILLISTLAWHTQNLLADPRASLMVAELPAQGDALTGARMTVMGRFEKVDDQALKRRYLARHPTAGFYAEFKDFAFWRMQPELVHAVAGFGRIETLQADEVFPQAREMAELEAGAIAHMAEDHANAAGRYAVELLGAEPGPWKILGIDPDGCDLGHGELSLRLPFEEPVFTGGALRAKLAKMLKN
ncbi:HugZ family protein [Aestuariivirga sp.]|uniref:HugZ family pyridoxamine 5'-phosphate oxidase n=1 Tax=Aestuariivirga sp. TaxID=2650926 RepID=UPI0039E325FA